MGVLILPFPRFPHRASRPPRALDHGSSRPEIVPFFASPSYHPSQRTALSAFPLARRDRSEVPVPFDWGLDSGLSLLQSQSRRVETGSVGSRETYVSEHVVRRRRGVRQAKRSAIQSSVSKATGGRRRQSNESGRERGAKRTRNRHDSPVERGTRS